MEEEGKGQLLQQPNTPTHDVALPKRWFIIGKRMFWLQNREKNKKSTVLLNLSQ